MTEEEERQLEAAVGMDMSEITETLAVADDDEAPPPDGDGGEVDKDSIEDVSVFCPPVDEDCLSCKQRSPLCRYFLEAL